MRAVAEAVYRPDIYREASSELELACPDDDYKIEGKHSQPWCLDSDQGEILMGPDCFLDGGIFNPSQAVQYIRNFDIHNMKIPPEELASRNKKISAESQARSSERSNGV